MHNLLFGVPATQHHYSMSTCRAALIRWHAVLAALHYAAAASVFLLVERKGDWSVPVLSKFNVWVPNDDNSTCADGCAIVEYQRELPVKLRLGVCVALFSVLSGSHHVYAATRGVAYADALVTAHGVSVVRWVDYYLSASLMFMVDSVLWYAPPSVAQLVLTASVMAAVITAGYGSEVAWSADRNSDAIAIFSAACVPFAAAFAASYVAFTEGVGDLHADARPVAWQGAVAQAIKQGSSPPAFVYAIFAWILGTYSLFPAAHAYRLATMRASTATPDALFRMEAVYAYLSFFAKVPLLAVYATAVVGRSTMRIRVEGDTGGEQQAPTSDSDTYLALGVAAGVAVVLGCLMVWDFKRHATHTLQRPPKVRIEMLRRRRARGGDENKSLM